MSAFRTPAADCWHPHGYVGMRRRAATETTVQYGCDRCGRTAEPPRCDGTKKDGSRCAQAAKPLSARCFWHDRVDGGPSAPVGSDTYVTEGS